MLEDDMASAVVPLPKNRALIALPTDELLDEFGAGRHSPGSGSAAALMALLSAKLSATVYKISIRRDHGDAAQFAYLLKQLEDVLVPRLKTLFQEDAEKFDEVILVRQARDLESDSAAKRRLRERALRLLRQATDIISEIVRICSQLVDYGIIAFDSGPDRVRGDSGSAISVAIAGAMSGLFILKLNLESFSEGQWATDQRATVDRLQDMILNKQAEALARIARLAPADVRSAQSSFL
ncbi:cyclodeaminase/cyclohydrolase family protein [Hephaestia mangrovi]|uniref:cyclodeaminase/cyclohydrolase family protein n=1 Tax=Hephaestia mangrovi TaxID=2873268 RepID=UPI001CA6A324|nr:cyclodeaminase/cyclohydrolase family protein [Hephaestia mangrovi]MBY8827570.1 cyclodeaminase/cyclohydrolase family protein [Hephaestia mangrovi]